VQHRSTAPIEVVRPFNEVAARLKTLGAALSATEARPFPDWKISADRSGGAAMRTFDRANRLKLKDAPLVRFSVPALISRLEIV
jgi:hypothetical protein